MRFVKLANPVSIKANLILAITWTPFWLLSVIVLGICTPIVCAALDPYDQENRFTFGYHVKAVLSKTEQ